MSNRPRSILPMGLLAILVVVMAFVSLGPSGFARAKRGGSSLTPVIKREAALASFSNPGFDSGSWYWDAYLTPASFVPTNWHIWYKDGTIPFFTRVTTKHVDGDEAVRGHAYWSGQLKAGVYQTIDDATPCLTYEFQMWGRSEASEGDDALNHLKIGIHPTGYYPSDKAAKDGEGFSDTVWGSSQSNCVAAWCFLSVTAEALAEDVTVYTYAQATGGTSHDIIWDAGDFSDVTPAAIEDDPGSVATGGVNVTSVVTGSTTTAQINWTTSNSALAQVYYRLNPLVTTTTFTHTLHLPVIASSDSGVWNTTTLDKTPDTSHTTNLSGLLPDREYRFYAVSRGLNGGVCDSRRSVEGTFTTDAP